MRTRGATIEKDNNSGFSVVEVWDDTPDGVKKLIGYVILDKDGNEIGFFTDIGEALGEFKRFSDDAEHEQPSPN